jgi:hypothetical protein
MQLPLFVLVSAAWFDKDPSTAAARLLQGAPVYVIPLGDVTHLTLFSSEDEANACIRWQHLEDKYRPVPMEMPHECAMLLERVVAFGVTEVVIDIANTIPATYPISYILEQVRAARLERGDGG